MQYASEDSRQLALGFPAEVNPHGLAQTRCFQNPWWPNFHSPVNTTCSQFPSPSCAVFTTAVFNSARFWSGSFASWAIYFSHLEMAVCVVPSGVETTWEKAGAHWWLVLLSLPQEGVSDIARVGWSCAAFRRGWPKYFFFFLLQRLLWSFWEFISCVAAV